MKNDLSSTLKYLIGEKERGLVKLQSQLGYLFKDKLLLLRAMIHRSYLHEQSGELKQDNETLEFLGDAVLDLVISNLLIQKYPDMDEGQLTKVRSCLVQEKHLAFMANEISLGDHLLLGKGEECSEGRRKNSILSCAYEAVIGAIFQDGGYNAVQKVVENKFVSQLDEGIKEASIADAKSRLQEVIQAGSSAAPSYHLEKSEGPDHAKVFTVSVRLHDKIIATASARSKKAAEQKAAAMALDLI